MGDFVDIESTINYSSCLEPSLCMVFSQSIVVWYFISCIHSRLYGYFNEIYCGVFQQMIVAYSLACCSEGDIN